VIRYNITEPDAAADVNINYITFFVIKFPKQNYYKLETYTQSMHTHVSSRLDDPETLTFDL